MTLLEEARIKLKNLVSENCKNPAETSIIVSARNLTPLEAIGTPNRNDYPLLNGKEVMMEASFDGSLGQAFTDQPGNFEGTLEEVLNIPFNSNFNRAVFISTLNAFMRSINLLTDTIHCKDTEPQTCADNLPSFLHKHYGNPKIAFIGLQPGLIQALVDAKFELRASDLNPDNIGQIRCGTKIYDAKYNAENVAWADIVLATGSVLVNDSHLELQQNKPIIYFGVTVAGMAKLFNLNRYCYCGR